MKTKYTKTIQKAFLMTGVLALSPSMVLAKNIVGRVANKGTNPHATIRVYDTQGKLVGEKYGATDVNGVFSVDVAADNVSGFRVMAMGDRERMMAVIPRNFNPDINAVNLVGGATNLQGQMGPEWALEKLTEGILTSSGSQIFDSLMKGIGIGGDKSEEMLNILNQVVARLEQIEKQLDGLNIQIEVARYENGVRPINQDADEMQTLLAEIQDLNLHLIEAKGDPARINKIVTNISTRKESLKPLLRRILSGVHSNFTAQQGQAPLQDLYSQIVRDQNKIIDASYFAAVDTHYAKFHTQV